jgi:hypothetical protein
MEHVFQQAENMEEFVQKRIKVLNARLQDVQVWCVHDVYVCANCLEVFIFIYCCVLWCGVVWCGLCVQMDLEWMSSHRKTDAWEVRRYR